jgi:hypothetical protein
MSSNQQNRQNYGQSAQQSRQSYGQSAQQSRQDYYDNQWDNYRAPYYGGAVAAGAVGAAVGYAAGASTGYAAGAATTPAYYSTLPCTPTVVSVGGINYSQCGSSWYSQAYSGSGVSYVIVNPPAGY